MKIVVLDGYTLNPGDLSWDGLRKLGNTVIYDRTNPEDIQERIKDAEVVLTNKTRLNAAALDASPSLKFIAVLATGYDVVDIEAAADRGIIVSNVPVYGTRSVSQFAWALLLEICCQVGIHSESVHQGEWTGNPDWSYWKTPLLELDGKTMGIIGYGRIGKNTGAIAKAMGMKVIVSDPAADGSDDAEPVSVEQLCRRADVIVLHCPLTKENYQLMNKETLDLMKPDAILINNARGGLINETDLAYALNHHQIFAAGLDVVSSEPIAADNPLLTARNCFITPHMSWGTLEARKRIMEETCSNVAGFINNHILNQVN